MSHDQVDDDSRCTDCLLVVCVARSHGQEKEERTKSTSNERSTPDQSSGGRAGILCL